MANFSRRAFVGSGLLGAAGLLTSGKVGVSAEQDAKQGAEKTAENAASERPIVLHQTDLFHPHGDPDDHFDLAVIFGLAKRREVDLRGVILDYPPIGPSNGDPAVVAMAQMNRIGASAVPGVVGTSLKMKRPDDRFDGAPERELASVEFVLNVLRKAERPIRIKCGSSAPDVAVAALRAPELFREKCAGIYLNCGSAFPNPDRPNEQEYNISVNRAGQAALFNDVPCPVFWFPCWHKTLDWKTGGHATYFEGKQEEILRDISPALRYFMFYMFTKSTDPNWMRNMEKGVPDDRWLEVIRSQNNGGRSLWATASLLLMANRTVTKDGEIVATSEVAPGDALYRLENIRIRADEQGRFDWSLCNEESNRKIFHVLDDARYTPAMIRAVNSIFRALV